MKKKWWAIVLVLILAGAGYGGYTLYRQTTAQQSAAAAAATLEQETVVVKRGTLRLSVEASGSLAPKRELAVAFAKSGKVTEVLVEVGDVVRAGDVLARLDDVDARQSVADAELQVRQAEISLALAQVEAEAGLAQANLEAAQVDYERTLTNEAHTGDQLASARINLKQAQEALADAQANYDTAWDEAREWETYVQPYKTKIENERDSATRNLEKAKDSLAVARANYNLAVIGIDKSAPQDAEIKVLNAQITLDKQPIQLEQSQLSLEQARFKLATAQRSLEETVLVAPMDGVVTALNVQTGEWAAGNQAAVVLSDLTTLVVDIGLDESDVAHIALGQEALVTLDAFDDVELTGAITAIAPKANTQAGVVLYPVTITLDPTDVPIRAGMTADVEIVTDSAADVLIVPLKAIRSNDGQNFVQRQFRAGETDPTGFIMTPVDLGIVSDTYAEVRSGLAEGDVISIPSTETNANAGSGGSPGFGFFGGGRP
ncbi:MAG TPA: efflux RND transporter periplasmic adaptor subunit [Anaerolineae bacterium]|nr:efflux RND transporter periplasmic adaptor subunit [Anaerolineae bacterium]HQI83188.1 efflux RND transporter periplasmic adaptor subunit [Anaerolineae bacterium]